MSILPITTVITSLLNGNIIHSQRQIRQQSDKLVDKLTHGLRYANLKPTKDGANMVITSHRPSAAPMRILYVIPCLKRRFDTNIGNPLRTDVEITAWPEHCVNAAVVCGWLHCGAGCSPVWLLPWALYLLPALPWVGLPNNPRI